MAIMFLICPYGFDCGLILIWYAVMIYELLSCLQFSCGNGWNISIMDGLEWIWKYYGTYTNNIMVIGIQSIQWDEKR